MSTRSNMPRAKAILDYWLKKNDDRINKKYWIEEDNNISTCFACGTEIGTQRAHILPLCNGGTNEFNNLHLLCKHCHLESELFFDDLYWHWFDYKSQANSGSFQMLNNRVAVVVAYCKINNLNPIDYLK